MLSIRRTANLITKVRVSSGKRAFGAPAGGHGHDHADDHAHHDHPVCAVYFETIVFFVSNFAVGHSFGRVSLSRRVQ